MAGHGEYTGGVAAGQLWASVISVLRMLEGSGPVGKDLSFQGESGQRNYERKGQ